MVYTSAFHFHLSRTGNFKAKFGDILFNNVFVMPMKLKYSSYENERNNAYFMNFVRKFSLFQDDANKISV